MFNILNWGKFQFQFFYFLFWVLSFSSFFKPKKFGKIFFGKDLFFLAKNSTNFAISWKNKFARDFI